MEEKQELELQESLRRVAAQLKRNEWKFLAVRLGLSKADVDDIAKAHPGNFARQKSEMLSLWKRNFREYATPERLLRALKEMDRESRREGNTEAKAMSADLHEGKTHHTASSPARQRTLGLTPGVGRPGIGQSSSRSPSNSYLSSAVQIRGLPLPMQQREISARSHLASGTSSVLRHRDSGNNSSKWKRIASKPLKKHGQITIEVDVQNKLKPKRALKEDVETQNSREEVEIEKDPRILDKDGLSKCPPAQQPRKVRCNCSIHRGIEVDSGENVSVDKIDPFDNLLESLMDPFFKSLIQGSSEVDTAVDHLERMKGVFVDETKQKCLLFSCRCTDISGLESLWNDYENGNLAAMFETSLVTDQSLVSTGMTLTTRICEVEYKKCRELLSVAPKRKIKVPTDKPRDLTSLVVDTLFFNLCHESVDSSLNSPTSQCRQPTVR